MTATQGPAEFDTSSHAEFTEYYDKESLSEATRNRFAAIRSRAVILAGRDGASKRQLSMLDVGCGTGMQCLMWASEGDRAYGIDINAPLIEIGRKRADAAKLDIRFDVGSATALPYHDASMDVCLVSELLEHVQDWQSCLNEAVRILRPGGVLYASTTNFLCPKQHEFNLPLYAWYPGSLKRYFEKLAVTTRPQIANYAKYPAVNWFSYYALAAYLGQRGFTSFDRFDLISADSAGGLKRVILSAIKRSTLLRFVGHACTSGTIIFAVKK
jgi:ubiquinone/menaquinone biosynthesis C-methylase UbiE